jgi:hypothetical protein
VRDRDSDDAPQVTCHITRHVTHGDLTGPLQRAREPAVTVIYDNSPQYHHLGDCTDMSAPTIKLNSGYEIPTFGLGLGPSGLGM